MTTEVNSVHSLTMPVLAAPKFGAGLIFGMVGDNNLTEIEACAKDGHDLIPKIEAAIHDLSTGLITKAVEELILLAKDIPNLLSDCKGMDDDIAAIEAWAEIFGNKTKLVATVSKNFLLHKRGIKSDIADAKAAWAAHQYFSSGVSCADIVVKTVGPIEPVTPTLFDVNAVDPMAVPEFLAGFIYGMTGDNDLTEIESCYVASKELENWIQLAIGDLKKGGTNNDIQAAIEFGMAALILPQSLSTCEGMDDDIAAITEWA